MLAKTKRKRASIDLEVGLHLVTVKAIRWARTSDGEIMANDDGEMTIEILYETEKGETVSDLFPQTERMMWALDELRKATKVYVKDKQTPATEIKGKKIYIIVAGKCSVGEKGVKKDENGQIIYFKQVLKKFYQYVPGLRPSVEGDPKFNDGVPGGIFLLNDFDLKKYLMRTELKNDVF